jgi:hypothetical protein
MPFELDDCARADSAKTLGLAEVRKHRVDELEGLVDLLTDFGSSEHDFAGDKDEQYDLRLHHSVDQTWKELGFIRAEHVMATGQALKTDRELDVA